MNARAGRPATGGRMNVVRDSMTTTNGAGEPTMEEILASIRNIISEDPPSGQVGENTEGAGGAPGPVVQPSASSSSQSAAAAHSGAQSTGQRSSVDLRATPAAGLLPPIGGYGSTEVAGSPADDFSDVFEEPLQRLSISPSPAAKAGSGPGNGAAHFQQRMPHETNGSRHLNGVSDLKLPSADDTPSNSPASKSLPRQDFDFGTLRPSRNDDPQPASVASGLFGTAEQEKEEAASQSSDLTERLTDTDSESGPLDENIAEQPRRKVVIAAMPTNAAASSEAAETPVSKKTESESQDSEVNVSAPADLSPPTAKNGDSALKTANVGFLAATPRPIEPEEAKSTNTGRAFFDAVAGEAKKETVFPPAATDRAESAVSVTTEAAKDEAPTDGSDAPSTGTKSEAVSETTASPETAVAESEAVEDASNSDTVAVKADTATQSLEHGLSVANIVVSSEGGKVRTLEDTVAEMLRPLLREWLENNMPRIVESALRLEMADSVKKQIEVSGQKPNGTAK